MCMYAKISGRNYFKGGECKTRENFKFKIFRYKGGKTVVYRNSPKKSWDFYRSRMIKRIAPSESSREN